MDRVASIWLAFIAVAAVSIAPCWRYSADWGAWGVFVVISCGATVLAVRLVLKAPHLLQRDSRRLRTRQPIELNKTPVLNSKL